MTKTLLIGVLSSAALFAGLIGFGAGMKTNALVRPPIGADRVPIRRMAIEFAGPPGQLQHGRVRGQYRRVRRD